MNRAWNFNIIRGRLRSSFSPPDIPDLSLWYDISAIDGLANEDLITSLNDLGPYSHHLSTSGGGSSPKYLTNQKNGLAAMEYGTDLLTNASVSASFIDANEATIYVVSNPASGYITNSLNMVGRAGAVIKTSCSSSGSPTSTSFQYAATISDTPSPGFFDVWHYQEFRKSGTSGEIYNDNTLFLSDTFGSSWPPPSTVSITLLSSGMGSKLGEVLMFSRALNPTERQQMSDYLASKWGF